MDWLYTSAPCLRNLTASELSGAIQRYGALVIDKDVSDQELNLKLDNFYDEAYIMIRMNGISLETDTFILRNNE